MTSTIKRLLLCVTFMIALSHNSGAQPAMVTALIGGLTVDKVLNNFADRLNHTIQLSVAAGALGTTATASNLLLTVQALHQQLHDELNIQWNSLEGQKLDAIRQLNNTIDQVDVKMEEARSLEDVASLDVENTLNRIPFIEKQYSIKSVTKSVQIFKDTGFYRISIRGNVFPRSGFTFSINGKALPNDWIVQPGDTEVDVSISTDLLNKYFKPDSINSIALALDTNVSNRRSAIAFWKRPTRPAHYDINVELLPIYPVEYRLIEHTTETNVDKSHPAFISSVHAVIPGCGKSGCNDFRTVYASLPAGSLGTGNYRDGGDSYNGYGEWASGTFTLNGTAASRIYHQGSADQTREVWFEVEYWPASDSAAESEVVLRPLTIDEPEFYLSSLTSPQAMAKPVLPIGRATGIPNLMTQEEWHAFSLNGYKQLPPRLGRLRYGMTYVADLSPAMLTYDLILRTGFAGDERVITRAAGSEGEAKLENFSSLKRLIVTPKAPW